VANVRENFFNFKSLIYNFSTSQNIADSIFSVERACKKIILYKLTMSHSPLTIM
jgi:hypothetical protein